MKKKTKEQEIEELRQDIVREIANWLHVYEDGCRDPFHTDGENLMLIRNHILHDKRELQELCTDGKFPDEYYLPTPPEVDMDYMAKGNKHLERRLRIMKRQVTYAKSAKYDYTQRALF